MKAVQVLSPGNAAVVDVPIPKLPSPVHLLIKTVAVALNPTDWKHVENEPGPVIVGCDFSGIVEEVGSDLHPAFRKGDHVWGAVHGSNPLQPDNGAFGEYLVAKRTMVGRVPEGRTWEEMATLGVGILTVGQGLYQAMKLPFPGEGGDGKKKTILIYGGSSASGALGIQFAKLSGLEVLTTCSPSNFDYVRGLGADVVFDYNSPTCAADIRAHTDNKLYYIWDTISNATSYAIGASCLSSSPPADQTLHYGTIQPPPEAGTFAENVVVAFTLSYSAQGEPWEMGPWKFPASEEDYKFMIKWMEIAQGLLEEGKIKPHRQEVREGGLEGIMKGLQDLKEGKVSGVKVVYRFGEI